jgi:Na+-transporting NADH:ubiquinone oxidoreductase subunit C
VQYSMKYIFGFAAAVCFVCSILISTANVGLRERQEVNKLLDKQKSVLQAAWLVEPGEKLDRTRVEEIFKNVRPRLLDLTTDTLLDDAALAAYDETKTPKAVAPENNAGILEVPEQVQIYEVLDGDKISMRVLPIVGKGLWSTMKGFLALDADGCTIRGLTYYEQAETPGLGGEVNNPRWKALWKGRIAYDESGNPAIEVIKGPAGTPEETPHKVDGLSGATLTGRGVTNMLRFWLGENGYAPFLKSISKSGSA